MKRCNFLLCLPLLAALGLNAAAEGEDWPQLRRDVESSQPDDEMDARRQAIREKALAKFTAADADHSGGLDAKEAAQLKVELGEHFDQIDDNGDGQLSQREIAQAWKKRQAFRREHGLRPKRPLRRP